MNHTTQPSFHEELAAHLADKAAPLPHPPETIMIADPLAEQIRLADVRMKHLQAMSDSLSRGGRGGITEAKLRMLSREELAEAQAIDAGLIDPQSRTLRILRERAQQAQDKLQRLRGELPKPTGPVNEQFTPRVNWWGASLVGYLLVAAGALAVGLVRGCAA